MSSKEAELATHVSARTILVLLAFSMVNFVLPSWPAMRPKDSTINTIILLAKDAATYRLLGTGGRHAAFSHP